jgi:hypothetical protein
MRTIIIKCDKCGSELIWLPELQVNEANLKIKKHKDFNFGYRIVFRCLKCKDVVSFRNKNNFY